MRLSGFVLLACLGPVRFAAAQNVTLLPDLGIAQAEYNDALQAWMQNDRDLEKDLLTGDPEQMRGRVRKAADLRDRVMAKKQAYLDRMIQNVGEVRSRMAPADSSEIPVRDFRKDLESQLDHVRADEGRIEQSLRLAPKTEDSFLIRRALEAELADVLDLQNNIAGRIGTLDALDRAQQDLRGVTQGKTEAQTLDEVLKIWEQERAAAVRQRASWVELYRSMEQTIDQRAPGSQRTGGQNKSAAGVSSRAPAKQPAATPAVTRLTGTWIYRSRPGAWKGEGEPQNVILELRAEDGNLRGTYSALLPVKGSLHPVRLTLAGPATSPGAISLHWTSESPAAAGEMELKLEPDGKLSVTRIRSGNSFIPPGMEMLSQR